MKKVKNEVYDSTLRYLGSEGEEPPNEIWDEVFIYLRNDIISIVDHSRLILRDGWWV